MAFMGMGADVWGKGTLRNGVIAAALILPVFLFRHYVQDKGKFPEGMVDTDGIDARFSRRAGWRVWAALGLCVALVVGVHMMARLPG